MIGGKGAAGPPILPLQNPITLSVVTTWGSEGGLASGGLKGMVWLDVVGLATISKVEGPEAGDKNAAG